MGFLCYNIHNPSVNRRKGGADVKIHLEQGQKLVMNQQMTMAIEMLQMDAQELDTYLQELALENPMLEIHPPKETGIQSWNTVSANHSADDGGSLGELKAAADGSLKGEVREQIVTAHVPELMRRELLYLLGEMDAQGYLPADTGDLQAFFGDRQRYENAVAVLQSMDPPGVGARSLSERLCLQLRRRGVTDELPYQICRGHLEALARGQWNLIAKALKVSKSQVLEAQALILTLEARPSNGFGGSGTAPHVLPDVELVWQEGQFHVVPADRYMHSYNVDAFYTKMAQDPSLTPEEQAYFRSKTAQAKWAIQCVDRRRETLCACVEGILERQYDFFRGTADTPVSLTMTELAEQMEVSVSTVSRAVRGKYLTCRRGTFPLSAFFAKEINGPDSGTRQDALDTIKQLIAGENPDDPLSDRVIAERLTAQGLQLSRRTVAKYRESLNIPSAAVRRGRNQSS